ncbi:hypothetical protein Tco_0495208, partial [Tanacetum coccineum]
SKEAVSAVLMTERETKQMPIYFVSRALRGRWTFYTDGSSCVDECGAGVILTDPEGVEFTYALRFQFETTKQNTKH